MGRESLGEFEEAVMLVIASLENESYAVAVQEVLKEDGKREVNLSAIHATLYRLEKKGLLSSRLGGSTKTRGGKKKRLFAVTNAGFKALKASKDFRSKMWSTIPQLSLEGGSHE
ncbi:MAG: helix-turn-helix transcriptional regulator [Bacteroidota bacterium]